MTLRVRRLEPGDDRSAFRCGNPDLDRFVAQYAGQNQFRHHLGTTYVAVEGYVIAGFATMTASEILPAAMPTKSKKRLPRHPLPVLRLARLAVDEQARGQGVGGALMLATFAVARQMADNLGCIGILVDAKPEAVAFYRRFGFEAVDIVAGLLGDRPQPLPMFIELAQF